MPQWRIKAFWLKEKNSKGRSRRNSIRWSTFVSASLTCQRRLTWIENRRRLEYDFKLKNCAIVNVWLQIHKNLFFVESIADTKVADKSVRLINNNPHSSRDGVSCTWTLPMWGVVTENVLWCKCLKGKWRNKSFSRGQPD